MYCGTLKPLILGFSFSIILSRSLCVENVRKIAIIGGGIGGTSCAHFLNQLLGSKVEIDLYEGNKIGGRLAIEKLEGSYFEAGGAIIHPRNNYMKEFVRQTGLSVKMPMADGIVGIYNGNTFPFVESSSYYITLLKMFWRYGMDMYKLNTYVNDLLDKFDNIYGLQKLHHSFVTVNELLNAMDPSIPPYLSKSAEYAFEEEIQFNKKLTRELILASVRVNYGQTNSVHQFVASVSVAGAMDGLWSVDKGNYQVAERLLNISGANLVPKKVISVELVNNSNKYNVITDSNKGEYDIVIVATPITKDARLPISFDNFPTTFTVPGSYHNTICTFVMGSINYTFFNFDHNDHVPESIFSINETTFYNSISLLKKNGSHSVYKVFSQKLLTDRQLALLFKMVHNTKVIDWLAYPNYSTTQRNDSFILQKNLYYVNAIEWAASAMEMSAIGAKNVALLLYNDLINTPNLYLKDTVAYVSSKSEL